jgi:hypothetical protein
MHNLAIDINFSCFKKSIIMFGPKKVEKTANVNISLCYFPNRMGIMKSGMGRNEMTRNVKKMPKITLQ